MSNVKADALESVHDLPNYKGWVKRLEGRWYKAKYYVEVPLNKQANIHMPAFVRNHLRSVPRGKFSVRVRTAIYNEHTQLGYGTRSREKIQTMTHRTTSFTFYFEDSKDADVFNAFVRDVKWMDKERKMIREEPEQTAGEVDNLITQSVEDAEGYATRKGMINA